MKLTAKSPTPNKYPRMLTQIMAAMENTSIVFLVLSGYHDFRKKGIKVGKTG